MTGILNYWAFCLTVLVFLALPGPGTFAILTSSAKGGLRGGFVALCGLMLGDWFLMAAALLGVAALLQAHPAVFKGVQYLGVAYLGWVGGNLLFRKGGASSATLLPIDHGRFLRQSFLITLINPKAIVFYMAFFPLFIDPATAQVPWTFFAMALTITVLTLFYGGLLVLVGNFAAQRLGKHPVVAKLASRLAGIALIGFGAKLAVND